MYEYEIKNKNTNEIEYVFGYSLNDACRRSKLRANDWIILSRDYID